MSRLSKVSELSDESESTASTSRAVNFSRPRPQSRLSHESQRPDSALRNRDSATHSLSAFYEPNRHLSAEQRFSLDSERTQTTSSDNSAGSEYAWDGRTGELVPRPRRKQFDDQRYVQSPRSRPPTGKTTQSDASMVAFAEPPRPPVASSSQIFKRVSVDVHSDRMSMLTDSQFEDTASHHTVSDEDEDEDTESGSYDAAGRWRSSDYDTSGLTDAKIRKLLRKGVNPSLYAEMKAAKKKSRNKWIGPLVGNSFLG